jgi:RNA recognition motif-containing protein
MHRPINITIHSKPEGPNSTELHRGFGYVEFEDPEDTKDAIDNMDQSELFGRVIKVSAAKPPKNVNEGLGSKTALWEQVRLFVLWLYVLLAIQLLTFYPRRAGLQRML